MTELTTSLQSPGFLTDITSLRFRSDAGSFELHFVDDREQFDFFSVTLATDNSGYATLFNAADPIRSYMENNDIALLDFCIFIEDEDGPANPLLFYVLYNTFDLGYKASILLPKMFLHTQQTLVVPIGETITVQWLAVAGEVVDLSATSASLRDGKVLHNVHSLYHADAVAYPRLLSYDITWDDFIKDYEEKLISLSLICGERSLLLYFRDKAPALKFTFRNNFFLWQDCFLYGTLKEVLDVKTSEAVVAQETIQYDRTATKKYEFQSALMPAAHLQIFQELFASPNIIWNRRRVIIIDHEFEVSKDSPDLQQVKFSFRLASSTPSLDFKLPTTSSVFTEQFSSPFA